MPPYSLPRPPLPLPPAHAESVSNHSSIRQREHDEYIAEIDLKLHYTHTQEVERSHINRHLYCTEEFYLHHHRYCLPSIAQLCSQEARNFHTQNPLLWRSRVKDADHRSLVPPRCHLITRLRLNTTHRNIGLLSTCPMHFRTWLTHLNAQIVRSFFLPLPW